MRKGIQSPPPQIHLRSTNKEVKKNPRPYDIQKPTVYKFESIEGKGSKNKQTFEMNEYEIDRR